MFERNWKLIGINFPTDICCRIWISMFCAIACSHMHLSIKGKYLGWAFAVPTQRLSFKMAKKSFAVSLVILFVVVALMATMSQAASTGSVGNLKEVNNRSQNSSEMNIEEATKMCNQSFVIKLGLSLCSQIICVLLTIISNPQIICKSSTERGVSRTKVMWYQCALWNVISRKSE